MKRVFMLVSIIFFAGACIGLSRFTSGNTVSLPRLRSILDSCRANHQGNAYFHCIRRSFDRLVYPRNLPLVIGRVEEIMTRDASGNTIAAGACHEVAHIVGEIAGSRAEDVSALVPVCGNRCGYGCAHGVVVGKLRQVQNMEHLWQSICTFSQDTAVSKAVAIPCFHGVGHAIAEYESYDVKRSIDRCSRFVSEEAKRGCWAGVFMETFLPPSQLHGGVPIPRDVVSYCKALGEDAVADMCIGQILSAGYQKNADDAYAFGVCSALPADKVEQCARGLGAQVYFVALGDPERIVQICQNQGHLARSCIKGAIDSSLAMHMNKSRSLDICQVVPGERKWCLESVASQYHVFSETFE